MTHIPPAPLRIALLQTNIRPENPSGMCAYYTDTINEYAGKADLFVCPELMMHGYRREMQDCASNTENDNTLSELTLLAKARNIGVIGSMLAEQETGVIFGRAFLIYPSGEIRFQDKRHLFRMAGEHKLLSPASERRIFTFRRWKILITVCYDLRFPVWCRNKGGDEYDLMINIANWPTARISSFETLLRARAMENMTFVAGVNRTGCDEYGVEYNGRSVALDPYGKELCPPLREENGVQIVTLDYDRLSDSHRKFPAWMDADEFLLKI